MTASGSRKIVRSPATAVAILAWFANKTINRDRTKPIMDSDRRSNFVQNTVWLRTGK
jgi:hypothetical protein